MDTAKVDRLKSRGNVKGLTKALASRAVVQHYNRTELFQDPDVRLAAAIALGEMRSDDPRAVTALAASRYADDAEPVRKAAAEALKRIDPDWRESEAGRAGVWQAMERHLKTLQSRKWTAEHYNDSWRSQWEDAARALGQIGDARAVEPLVEAGRVTSADLDGMSIDPDQLQKVRKAIRHALRQLGERRAAEEVEDAVAPAMAEPARAGEPLTLAVTAHEDRPGALRLVGEDGAGRAYDLREVTEAALLLVPKDTLPHLQGDRELWSRVRNPDAASDAPSPTPDAGSEGVLAAALAGPLMASVGARDLSPGQFQVSVVDTYAGAVTAVKGVGLFG